MARSRWSKKTYIQKFGPISGPVYHWEDNQDWMVRGEYMSLYECEDLVTSIRKSLGLKKIKVHDGRGYDSGRGDHLHGVGLPKWTRNKPIIIHETTHTVCTELYNCWHHGDEFVPTYIFLLNKHLGIGKRRLIKSAKEAGIL